MNLRFPRCAARLLATGVLTCGLLAGCGSSGGDSDDAAAHADTQASVSVTTAKPVQRSFSDSIEAFGSAQGDPRHARSLSLAHGGQIAAIQVSAGQSVHAGETLLQVITDPTARQAYLQAQSALTLAQGELKRTTQLSAQHLATQSQLATVRKAVTDAEAGLQAQRDLGGAAAVDAVMAPADGVITTVTVALGERVQANAPLLTFTPAKGLIAQLGIQPAAAAQLKPGMPVVLHAVYGDLPPANGSVSMLGNALDAQTHLLPLQASIPAAMAAQLVAGAALDAQIQTASYTAWAVPRQALRQDDTGNFVFQLDQGHARRVAVKVRSPAGDTIGVDGPLDAKLPVIVLGAYELTDGMAVSEHKS